MKSSGKTYQDYNVILLHLYEKGKEELQRKRTIGAELLPPKNIWEEIPFKIAIEDSASFLNTNLSQEEKNDIIRWTKNWQIRISRGEKTVMATYSPEIEIIWKTSRL